jgi:predicted ATP-dependent endonuclease of OLD family
MITRLYVDNFRSLVNFEIKFEETNLLLGPNGSGKSSVFDVLRRLRRFIGGETNFAEVFSSDDLTRWQTNPHQKFELELKTEEYGTFLYVLVVEYAEKLDGVFTKSKVKEEKLTLGAQILSHTQDGETHLYDDTGDLSVTIELGSFFLSGLSISPERNKKLSCFKQRIEDIVIVRPTPVLMKSESQREAKHLSLRMENFAAWYRYLAQENLEAVQELLAELPRSIPGLKTLNSVSAGENVRILKAVFQTNNKAPKGVESFASLSDGQKMLIAIYALIIGNKGKHASLFIDEPDNYISIDEIQPWLRLFIDDCGEGESLAQVVLISHHPEVIDYAALGVPIWFEREPESPTRIRPMQKEDDEEKHSAAPLPLSQIIARKLVKQ